LPAIGYLQGWSCNVCTIANATDLLAHVEQTLAYSAWNIARCFSRRMRSRPLSALPRSSRGGGEGWPRFLSSVCSRRASWCSLSGVRVHCERASSSLVVRCSSKPRSRENDAGSNELTITKAREWTKRAMLGSVLPRNSSPACKSVLRREVWMLRGARCHRTRSSHVIDPATCSRRMSCNHLAIRFQLFFARDATAGNVPVRWLLRLAARAFAAS
jgi:hypothetical protein